MKQVIILIILMFVLALGGCQSAKERHSVKSNVVVHETLDTLTCLELRTLFMTSPTFSYKEIFEKDSYEEISEMKLNSVKFTLHEYYTQADGNDDSIGTTVRYIELSSSNRVRLAACVNKLYKNHVHLFPKDDSTFMYYGISNYEFVNVIDAAK